MPLCIFELLVAYIREYKAGRFSTKRAIGQKLGIKADAIGYRYRSAVDLGILEDTKWNKDGHWCRITPFGAELLRQALAGELEVIFNRSTLVSTKELLPKAKFRQLEHWDYVNAVKALRARSRSESDR